MPEYQALAIYQGLPLDPQDLFLHLLSFVAPAVAVGLGVAFAARLLLAQKFQGRSCWGFAAINSVAGIGVLLAGLWYFGVDGKMATYCVLVVAVATCQWLSVGGWKA